SQVTAPANSLRLTDFIVCLLWIELPTEALLRPQQNGHHGHRYRRENHIQVEGFHVHLQTTHTLPPCHSGTGGFVRVSSEWSFGNGHKMSIHVTNNVWPPPSSLPPPNVSF